MPRLARLSVLVLVSGAAFLRESRAQDVVEPYVDVSGALARTRPGGLRPTAHVPQLETGVEVGVKGQWSLLESSGSGSGWARARLDAALRGRWAGSFRTLDARGNEEEVRPSSRDVHRLSLRLREAVVAVPDAPTALHVGKRRLDLGPGIALNPANPLAPRKDLLNPRNLDDVDGRWMASFERQAPLGSLGLHAAPGVREHEDGWPEAVFRYAAEKGAPRAAHGAALLRASVVVGDTELSAAGAFLHRHENARRVEPGAGFTLQKTIDNLTSFHGEVFLTRGYERWEASEPCVATEAALRACLERNETVFSTPHADARAWSAAFVLGGRRALFDDETLALEWAHDSSGETPREFERVVAAKAHLDALARQGGALVASDAYGAARAGLARSLGKAERDFRPRGRNALLVSVEDIRVLDVLRFGAGGVLSLRDNSGLVGPRLSYPGDAWHAEIQARLPYVLGPRKGARNPSGGRVTEADAWVYRSLVEARVRVLF